MFGLENFVHTFSQQLINVINSNLPTEINKGILVP